MKSTLPLILALLMSPCSTPVLAMAAASSTNGLIDIQADRQIYNQNKHESQFAGNVRVAFHEYRIASPLAAISLDANGNAQVANFYPNAKASRFDKKSQKTDNLDADTIKILMVQDQMVAEGHAHSVVNSAATNPFIIHSQTQQFDNTTRTMSAAGDVVVDYKEGKALSPKAVMYVDAEGHAEKVVFSGGAKIVKPDGDITGNQITVFVPTGNMIAENQVISTVTSKKPSGSQSPVIVHSSFQNYDKATDTVIASGNVVIDYEDYHATGPKATFKLKGGKMDKVVMTGRASINDAERHITADKIVITIDPKSFDATGNVKTQFKSQSKQAEPAAAPTPGTKKAAKSTSKGPATKPQPKKPASADPTDMEEEAH